jgi:hypothetical protein
MGDLYLDTPAGAGAVDIALSGPLTSRTAPQVRAALSPHRSAVSHVRLRNCTHIDLDGLSCCSSGSESPDECQAWGTLALRWRW